MPRLRLTTCETWLLKKKGQVNCTVILVYKSSFASNCKRFLINWSFKKTAFFQTTNWIASEFLGSVHSFSRNIFFPHWNIYVPVKLEHWFKWLFDWLSEYLLVEISDIDVTPIAFEYTLRTWWIETTWWRSIIHVNMKSQANKAHDKIYDAKIVRKYVDACANSNSHT